MIKAKFKNSISEEFIQYSCYYYISISIGSKKTCIL